MTKMLQRGQDFFAAEIELEDFAVVMMSSLLTSAHFGLRYRIGGKLQAAFHHAVCSFARQSSSAEGGRTRRGGAGC